MKQWQSLFKVFLLICGVLLTAALVVPNLQFLMAQDEDNGGKGGKKKQPTPVYVQVLKTERLIEKLTVSGTVIPAKEVQMTTESSGKITSLPLQEGQYVQKGDLLLKINDKELQARLTRTRHQKKLLEQQVYRKKKLLEQKGISQEEYDQAKTELESIKADIQLIQAQVEKTEIRAPFDGVVGLKHVSEGSYVSPDTRVAMLRQVQPLKIDFSIPGKHAHALEEGQSISFTTNGLDSTRTARIYATESAIETSTRTLHIRALYDNKDRQVMPGSFAEINLSLSSEEGAVMVPAESIISELQGKKVFLYKNGKSIPRTVQTGQRQSQRVQVTKGLSAGDTIITRGIQKIRPSSPVTIKKVEQPEFAKAGI